MEQNEVGHLSQTTYKNYPRCITDLNVNTETVRSLEENIGVDLHDRGSGSGFLDTTARAQAAKGKIHRLESIKIETF